MALVLTGTVVTFDRARPLIDPGAVYVGDDGRLAAVSRAGDPAPAGFANTAAIDTGAVIYPGLIDLHNHIAYNTLPLWRAKGVPYLHHDRWPDETKPPDYSTSITWPAQGARPGCPRGAAQVRRGQGPGRRHDVYPGRAAFDSAGRTAGFCASSTSRSCPGR